MKPEIFARPLVPERAQLQNRLIELSGTAAVTVQFSVVGAILCRIAFSCCSRTVRAADCS
jgi:hypothetical protein